MGFNDSSPCLRHLVSFLMYQCICFVFFGAKSLIVATIMCCQNFVSRLACHWLGIYIFEVSFFILSLVGLIIAIFIFATSSAKLRL